MDNSSVGSKTILPRHADNNCEPSSVGVSAIFDRAAELVGVGWVRRTYFQPGENGICYCAVGALAAAADVSPPNLSARYPAVTATLLHVLGLSVADEDDIVEGPIIDWNDAPERTQADVVSALRQAAALARGEVEPEGSSQHLSSVGEAGSEAQASPATEQKA